MEEEKSLSEKRKALVSWTSRSVGVFFYVNMMIEKLWSRLMTYYRKIEKT